MRTSEALVVGAIVGGVAVWLCGREIAGYVGEHTRGVRTKAADAVRAVQEKTGQVLDNSSDSLHRAEDFLQGAKERVSAALRAGQDAIRPESTTRDT